jgi:hypothetical protein
VEAGDSPALCNNDQAMKKQASDQQFHDRRHQERKRAEAEAAKKPLQKKSPPADSISNRAAPAPTPAANPKA